MTKKRTTKKETTKKRTTKKSSAKASEEPTSSEAGSGSKKGLTIGGLIVLVLVLGLLCLGDQTGLIDVDWDAIDPAALLEGEGLDEALDPSGAGVGNAPSQGSGSPGAPVAFQPVSGKWYRLYFSSPHFPDEEATRVNTIVDGLEEVINSARRSLDIAIYELDLPQLGEAILAARDRGVEVRMVTDSDTLEDLEVLIELDEAGIPIVPDERGAIMHNKFVVVDGQSVWTGSWNFTPNGTYRNDNNAIFIRSPELAANYTAEFEEMFNDGAFGPTSPANTINPVLAIGDTQVETCFSPEDECAVKLVDTLAQAQDSIRFMAFSFTDDAIGKSVRDRGKAGVTVQGVFETRGSNTEYSEYGRMRKQGLDVWQDGNPYTLHHKVFIVDDNTVVLGSYNFSANADESNDENILIVHNPEIAAQYNQEFERVYQQAQAAEEE
jgi:phosphatidylserine/phosphatidylglycerophosphate/cardiolipin synthase-like enzyme